MKISMYGWRTWTDPTIRDYKMRIWEAVTEDLYFTWSIGKVTRCEQGKKMKSEYITSQMHICSMWWHLTHIRASAFRQADPL